MDCLRTIERSPLRRLSREAERYQPRCYNGNGPVTHRCVTPLPPVIFMVAERENTTQYDDASGTAPMDGLEYVSVKGFKSIRSLEDLKLGPITVLIGANGSGKSNFIEIFSLLDALRKGRMMEYVITAGRATRLLHYGPWITQSLELEVGLASGLLSYRIALAPTADDLLVITMEGLKTGDAIEWDTARTAGLEAAIRRDVGWRPRLHEQVAQLFDGHRVYHFSDTGPRSPIKGTPSLHDNRYLLPDGRNIAAFLYLLQQKHQDSYRSIVNAVRLVAPFFDDFELAPDRLNPDQIRLRWQHVGGDNYFDVSSLSDGTLRFIALATLFLQPVEYRPAMVIVDEPELGLHPHAITVLGALMRQASVETRVVTATQSSTLVDQFEPADIVVTERSGGATDFRRLDDSELAVWLEDYSLGQLWEKNILGGRPVPE